MARSTALSFLADEIARLHQLGLWRQERVLGGRDRLHPVLDGRPLVSFCSNDYLGLASHPALIEAAAAGAGTHGAGSTASRLVCGTLDLHRDLERETADFVGTEAACVFSTGYMANVGTIAALVERSDVIAADRLVHASLIDGARLSGARLVRFPHNDVDHLDDLLARHAGARRRLVVTEGVFSMEGDLGRLAEISAVARRHEAILMVDDAHGLGVLGTTGRGTCEHLGLPTEAVDVLVGTFGKALGSFGAFVAGRRDLVDFLKNRARSYLYTTALAPAVVAVNRRAIALVRDYVTGRDRLAGYIRRLREALRQPPHPTPIIPVVLGDNRAALDASARLLDQGFLVQAIRPPSVPAGTARLRVTVSAGHQEAEVNALAQALPAIIARTSP